MRPFLCYLLNASLNLDVKYSALILSPRVSLREGIFEEVIC